MKTLHYNICLGILTLLLVTAAVPTLAHKVDSPDNLTSINKSQKNSQKNSQNLLAEGKNLFQSGRFAEAAKFWEQASWEFKKQGDVINQAWSLNYLSLAYQNLGEWRKAEDAITTSLNLLQQKKGNAASLAVAFNTQGGLKLAMGQAEAALKAWENAEKAYSAAKDEEGKIGSQINQAQALQTLGLYRRSQKLLGSIKEKLEHQDNSLVKVKALQSLGEALQIIGDLEQSQEVLKQSLTISQKLNLATDSSNILFSLGNTSRKLKQTEAALGYYQQAAKSTTHPSLRTQAQLNQLSLYVETSQWEQAKSALAPIKSQLVSLPPSRTSIYAAVNFASSLSRLAKQENSHLYQDASQILARGVQQAENLGDMRAKAYALSELGKLYYQTQQFSESLQISRQALQIAQSINASDIAYQAAWQVGRILKIKEDSPGAIAAYDSAVKTLTILRNDLVATSKDAQFSFQESVEPVYREFVELLLSPSPEEISQANLKLARETIEGLQLAELDNFFKEACLTATPQQIDKIDSTAAVIYPIILSNRLEVILSVPGKPLRNYKTEISEAEVEQTIKKMRRYLNPALSKQTGLRLSQQVYDWLIRPAEAELANSGVKTLAFVLDGSLRNVPMAALYDGKQYLVEKYGIALSPGMQLLKARTLQGNNLQVITAALSEARQGFKALPAVKQEVKEIAAQVSSKLLLNETFTNSNLKDSIKTKEVSVLHLATHGQFSSNSEDTFILTWDNKVKVKELDELFTVKNLSESTPVELLVLSACQTAKGDNRAILGLAGVAVRSGARSTLGTLWAVKDESTAKFMVEFYKQLRKPGITKAEALRNTQIAFLQNGDFQHPFYWSAFVLIGNWI
ncbi:MAG: CHAT domain-containing protein [Nostocaceae cyanobacterium]|nr:CHAT domain-containing protein [Nostocaceae cyanobacterium]